MSVNRIRRARLLVSLAVLVGGLVTATVVYAACVNTCECVQSDCTCPDCEFVNHTFPLADECKAYVKSDAETTCETDASGGDCTETNSADPVLKCCKVYLANENEGSCILGVSSAQDCEDCDLCGSDGEYQGEHGDVIPNDCSVDYGT